MIDTSTVTDAVLVRLRAVWAAVGDGQAPSTTVGSYGVLDVVAGGGGDGDLDNPERNQTVVYRVTAVSRPDPNNPRSVAGEREQAEFLAYRLVSALLDRSVPIAGTGWKVKGRTHVAAAGVIRDEAVVNVVNDVALMVVTA